MPASIIIFSADPVRGAITVEVLKRIGLESFQADSILEVRDAVSNSLPTVAILDTKSVFPDELNLLKNLSLFLKDTSVFVLGDQSIVDTFKAEGTHHHCLHDPFDPELIASKVKAIVSSPEIEKCSDQDSLEHALKQLLKLD